MKQHISNLVAKQTLEYTCLHVELENAPPPTEVWSKLCGPSC